MRRLGYVDGSVFYPPLGYSEALLAFQLSPCLHFRHIPQPQALCACPGTILVAKAPVTDQVPAICTAPASTLGTAYGVCGHNFPSLSPLTEQRWLDVNFLS